jgi:hypothetical protein
MIGEAPDTEEFGSVGCWIDGMQIHATTDRSERERAGSWLRHDWLYCIRAVSDILGVAHTDRTTARTRRLRHIAGAFDLPTAA